MAAMVDRDGRRARAVRDSLRAEGFGDDWFDEFGLLRAELGPRTPWWLHREIDRLWRLLRQFCSRCGRRSRYLDNDSVCTDCVVAEHHR